MEDLKKRLLLFRDQHNIRWETIELDYILSWLLVAISQHEQLSNNLVFKGGTALKKCWFSDYRYSQDLDFSEIVPSNDELLNQHIVQIIATTEKLIKPYGNFIFEVERYAGREPHPFNQAAFIVKVQTPWQKKPMTKVKLEISRDEKLVFKSIWRPILHEYGEEIKNNLQTYSLEEIVLEKFRGILQNQNKFDKKGWVRSRVRDFYDLWRIMQDYHESINTADFKDLFLKKCLDKDIKFVTPEQFFREEYLTYIRSDWNQFLIEVTKTLPSFDEVILKLKRHAYAIF